MSGRAQINDKAYRDCGPIGTSQGQRPLYAHCNPERITRRYYSGVPSPNPASNSQTVRYKTRIPSANCGASIHSSRQFVDGEAFEVGALRGRVMHVPGHTPADVAYVFDGMAFMGDTLFMPDVGTARCDFPGGDACKLYESIGKLLSLPAATRLFACHDYPPDGRDARWETTVAEQRAANIHVRDGIALGEFVAMRTARDATLGQPALIIPSIQLNIRAGVLPRAEENGVSYLKLPLNAF